MRSARLSAHFVDAAGDIIEKLVNATGGTLALHVPVRLFTETSSDPARRRRESPCTEVSLTAGIGGQIKACHEGLLLALVSPICGGATATTLDWIPNISIR